jgi:hypothetical protein
MQYDPNGLKEKFLGVYCRASDFQSLFVKYLQFVEKIEVEDINFISIEDLSKIYINASEIKILRTIYLRNETRLSLYHILVNLNL